MCPDTNTPIKIFITKTCDSQTILNLDCLYYCNTRQRTMFCEKLPSIHIDKDLFLSNKYYSEITTMYWADQNIKADYYGFFHYRRIIIFNDDKCKFPLLKNTMTQNQLVSYGLNDTNIRKSIEKYDIILPHPQNLLVTNGLFSSLYKQYKYSFDHDIRDLDNAIKFIHQNNQKFDKYVNKALKCKKIYTNNIFVMKKKYFNEYINWLKPILNYVHKNKDYTNCSRYAQRSLGFVAERLFNIFLFYLKDKYSDIKIKEYRMLILGTESELDASRKKGVKLKISEYTKLGRICRCIYHTIIGH